MSTVLTLTNASVQTKTPPPSSQYGVELVQNSVKHDKNMTKHDFFEQGVRRKSTFISSKKSKKMGDGIKPSLSVRIKKLSVQMTK